MYVPLVIVVILVMLMTDQAHHDDPNQIQRLPFQAVQGLNYPLDHLQKVIDVVASTFSPFSMIVSVTDLEFTAVSIDFRRIFQHAIAINTKIHKEQLIR